MNRMECACHALYDSEGVLTILVIALLVCHNIIDHITHFTAKLCSIANEIYLYIYINIYIYIYIYIYVYVLYIIYIYIYIYILCIYIGMIIKMY